MFEELFQSDPNAEAYTERQRAAEQMKLMQEARKKLQDRALEAADRPLDTGEIELEGLDSTKLRQIQEALMKNLERRNQALDELYKISRQDPVAAAKEAKAKQREGGNKVANFFRNIDYAVQGYGARDQAVALDQKQQAWDLFNKLLNSQGTELRNATTDQSKLATKIAELNQKRSGTAAKTINDAAKTQTSSDIAATRAIQSGAMTDSNIDKNSAIAENLRQRTAFMNPFFGGSKELQSEYALSRLPEDAQKKLKEGAANSKMFDTVLKSLLQRTGPETTVGTRMMINEAGQSVPVPTTTTRTKGQTMMEKMGFNPIDFIRSQTQGAGGPQAVNQGAGNPQTARALAAVETAMGAAQNRGNRTARAAAMIDPTVDKVEREAAKNGQNFIIERTPEAGNPGMYGSPGQRTAVVTGKQATADTNILAAMAGKGYVKGVAQKVFGFKNNRLSGTQNIGQAIGSVFSGGVLGSLIPKGDLKDTDPSYTLARGEIMSPKKLEDALKVNNMDDVETKAFKQQFEATLRRLRFGIQKESTGLVALSKEMNDIAIQLPQITDTAEIALLSIGSLAAKKNIEDYIQEIGGLDKVKTAKLNARLGAMLPAYVTKVMKNLDTMRGDYNSPKRPKDKDIDDFATGAFSASEVLGQLQELNGGEPLVPGLNARKIGERRPSMTPSPQGSPQGIPQSTQQYLDLINANERTRKLPRRSR